MNYTIACIGSRETPQLVLDWMSETATALVAAGCEIRSGNAPGADQAWAHGANEVDPTRVTLCLPWESFEATKMHAQNKRIIISSTSTKHQRFFEAVKETHPHFGKLSAAALLLYARNAMIVEDVHCVLGSLNPGKPGGGGTGGAFRMAQRNRIVTFNVADAMVRKMIEERLAAGQDVRGRVYELTGGKKW